MIKKNNNFVQKIKLGNVDQYIMIRSKNINNPLLLFLHGGPGLSHIPFAKKFQKSLEENFTVINWDQRGAGLSYSQDIEKESMNVDQFIEDAHELIQYILVKYSKKKLFLVGHSWGSYIGILLAKKYPGKFHAYIGVSQIINVLEASNLEYSHIIDTAEKSKNIKAVRELKEIGRPFYYDDTKYHTFRKWFNFYEGNKEINITSIALKGILLNIKYNKINIFKYINGLNFSQSILTEEIYSNIAESIQSIEVPVFFCSGINDFTTPLSLIQTYLDNLIAPKKEIFIFDKSAHCPHLQESEKFNNIINTIRKELEY